MSVQAHTIPLRHKPFKAGELIVSPTEIVYLVLPDYTTVSLGGTTFGQVSEPWTRDFKRFEEKLLLEQV